MNFCAATARRPRSDGSRMSQVSRALSPATSPGLNKNPVSPFRTSSELPPTFEATGQQPQAIASINEFESASEREGSTKISIARNQSATFAVAGTNWQASSMPSALACDWSRSNMTPLPTTTNFKPEQRYRTRSKADNSVSRSFSGRKAQTAPITRELEAGAFEME